MPKHGTLKPPHVYQLKIGKCLQGDMPVHSPCVKYCDLRNYQNARRKKFIWKLRTEEEGGLSLIKSHNRVPGCKNKGRLGKMCDGFVNMRAASVKKYLKVK